MLTKLGQSLVAGVHGCVVIAQFQRAGLQYKVWQRLDRNLTTEREVEDDVTGMQDMEQRDKACRLRDLYDDV